MGTLRSESTRHRCAGRSRPSPSLVVQLLQLAPAPVPLDRIGSRRTCRPPQQRDCLPRHPCQHGGLLMHRPVGPAPRPGRRGGSPAQGREELAPPQDAHLGALGQYPPADQCRVAGGKWPGGVGRGRQGRRWLGAAGRLGAVAGRWPVQTELSDRSTSARGRAGTGSGGGSAQSSPVSAHRPDRAVFPRQPAAFPPDPQARQAPAQPREGAASQPRDHLVPVPLTSAGPPDPGQCGGLAYRACSAPTCLGKRPRWPRGCGCRSVPAGRGADRGSRKWINAARCALESAKSRRYPMTSARRPRPRWIRLPS